ncbi:MAG TPA: heavy-metal-associated domain-containing protein [Clostridia bacterium]|nr:heavy-metal-associated domain-containing protein [Clostridia bacterium]
MKRKYRLNNLDCAACADKIERKISKLTGVKQVNLNFFTKKAAIETDSEEIFCECEKILKKHAGTFEIE